MNRFQFLFSQVDGMGQEIIYLMDNTSGQVYKTIALPLGQQTTTLSTAYIPPVTMPTFVPPTNHVVIPVAETAIAKGDPAGDIMTVEERRAQLNSTRKVPPAFLGNVDRMGVDPSLHPDARTDVTTHH